MENNYGAVKRSDPLELPPGFRFHPTDEELITHYLSKKVLDHDFAPVAIGDVDMNKVEPWELPWRARMGEKEWYFFCVRDKKYPTGLRTNRATAAGYWKATGKDKEIYRGKALVGMKKTLVFYRGRAPKGGKSNWVCHEYRLEGKFCLENFPKSIKNDWVISRVFQKTNGGKKVHISGLMRPNPPGDELPPLTDVKPRSDGETSSGHVHCFSSAGLAAPQKLEDELTTADFNGPSDFYPPPPSSALYSSFPAAASLFPWMKFPQVQAGIGFQLPGSGTIQDPAILRSFIASYSGLRKEREMVSVSQETAMSAENSSAVSNFEMGKRAFEDEQQDLDCIWNY